MLIKNSKNSDSVIDYLIKRKVKDVNFPEHIINDKIHYEVLVGSKATKTNLDDKCDIDYECICVPDERIIYPYHHGEIYGFGTKLERFDNWSSPKILCNDQIFDIKVHSIIKFMDMCLNSNFNFIELLFSNMKNTSMSCEFKTIRDKRNIFISKTLWEKYKKCNKSLFENPKYIKEDYDNKKLMDIIRILFNMNYVMFNQNLNPDPYINILKGIKLHDTSINDIIKINNEHIKILDNKINNKKIKENVNEEEVKNLLINFLDMCYN